MSDEDIMYHGFLTVWKVLGQCRPNISNEERFIAAIIATSGDKWERAKVVNKEKIARLRG